MNLEIGLDSFVAVAPDAAGEDRRRPADHLSDLLDEIALADQAGLDVFGVGEHHRPEFLDSAPAVILAAAAARPASITLALASTIAVPLAMSDFEPPVPPPATSSSLSFCLRRTRS